MAVSADFHFDGHEDWMADNENRELKIEEENLKDARDADQQASRDDSRPASFRLPRVQGKQWAVCEHFHNVNWCICHSVKLGRILTNELSRSRLNKRFMEIRLVAWDRFIFNRYFMT